MYQKTNDYWKSDFKINQVRYQKSWDTQDKELALRLEKEWKKHIKEPSIYPHPENGLIRLTFKEATEYLYETKWKYYRDKRNPKDRWIKISNFFGLNRYISTLTIDDLDRFKRYLVNKKYANKTVNHYISTLKSSIEYLERKQKITLENKLSFQDLKMRIESKRKICFSKYEELDMYNALVSIYDESNNPIDWEMIQFFIINSGLGLRPAEYYNLQIGDFDLEQNTVTINRGAYNSTKNDLIRTLPLNGVVLESVKLQLEFALTKLYELELNKPFVLKDEITNINYRKLNFTSLTKDMIEYRWNKMKKYLGWTDKERYKDYIPYGLRHTVASRLASISKWNGYKIMTFMGHKSFHTSLNYVHLGIEDIRDGGATNIQDIKIINYV
ncbi:tyrosine-type recombinase/integrase [Aliarcobacter butzleri]